MDGRWCHVQQRSVECLAALTFFSYLAQSWTGHVISRGCFRCRIGAGAVVAEGSVVESGGQIAAGTVVPPGCLVPKNELWAGNPAK